MRNHTYWPRPTWHHKVHHDVFLPLQHDRLAQQGFGIGSARLWRGSAGAGGQGPPRGRGRVPVGVGGATGCADGGGRGRRGSDHLPRLQAVLQASAVQQHVDVLGQAHHVATALHQLQLHQVAVAAGRVAPLLHVDDAQEGVDAEEG